MRELSTEIALPIAEPAACSAWFTGCFARDYSVVVVVGVSGVSSAFLQPCSEKATRARANATASSLVMIRAFIPIPFHSLVCIVLPQAIAQ